MHAQGRQTQAQRPDCGTRYGRLQCRVRCPDETCRRMGSHHVHAVVEDDLPQPLPAHNAEVLLIMVLVFMKGRLHAHTSTLTRYEALRISQVISHGSLIQPYTE